MKHRLILIPDDSANLQTPLPAGVLVPLEFPTVVANTMTPFGHIIINEFHAAIDGWFRFNVSSKAEIVEDYQVHIVVPSRNESYGHVNTAPRNAEGQADQIICSQKDVTIFLKAGQVAEFYDRQDKSINGARRWPYSDTNRIEITLED